ncbi:MAG: glycine--tRNA ligase subunit beta [Vicinamibacteria bacterium]
MADEPSRELLLEIGCEEIPAGWLEDLTRQLVERFAELSAREHLSASAHEAHSTPRRLVLRAQLPARQPDREERVFGPALKLAKEASGAWTKAALGFAKKNGVEPEALLDGAKDAASPDERYLLHVKAIPGRAAAQVLPALIAALLRSLAFPRKMSWDAWLDDGKGAFPFGRPIRWLLILLGGEVVPFTIFSLAGGSKGLPLVESGAVSRGHRFLPRGAADERFTVSGFDGLCAGLRARGVLLLREERLAAIRRALEPVRAELRDDHGLLADWASLVEHPNVVFGAIPPEFHALPREVIETVLVHHQKYVPLVTNGRVLRFAAITNIDADAAAEIVRGMERVVVARLRDAAFFYAEDRKRPLADRVADLAGVIFHQKLGSYGEKAERMVRLVAGMGEAEKGWLDPRQGASAETAARLAKADLTTLMVREFAELQGVVGGLYLQAEDASPSVAAAVRWHYHPLSIEEGAPPSGSLQPADVNVWGALSLADKLDTLAGYFGIGLVPTGSSDPFGLRRAAQGAVRVLLDFWCADEGTSRPDLNAVVRAAIAGYGNRITRRGPEVERDCAYFLLERLDTLLRSRGFPQEEVAAVVYAPWVDGLEIQPVARDDVRALSDVRDCMDRLAALHAVRALAREEFARLATAFKRINNILEEAVPSPGISSSLFEKDVERGLYGMIRELGQPSLIPERGRPGYERHLRALANLADPIDRFFDPHVGVFVMAEDLALRGNRLRLLADARNLFYRIADISRLGGTQ